MKLQPDSQRRLEALTVLSARARGVFAFLSSRRILPEYRVFHEATGRGDPDLLEAISDRVSQFFLGQEIELGDIKADAQACEGLMVEEDPWHDLMPAADDAVASLAYALRTICTGDAQDASWSAARVFESVFRYAEDALGVKPHQAGSREAVVAHPLLQQELVRQVRDLKRAEDLATARRATLRAALDSARKERVFVEASASPTS